jgi:SAM-dependent methyltransferase
LNPNPSLAPFFPIPHWAAVQMLSLAGLRSDELLYDLGCGTGEILVTAARDFRARAVGVELEKNIFKRAILRVKRNRVEDRVKVVHGDLFQVPLRDADVVTLYLTDEANQKVRPKLEWELKEGARVVSASFQVPGWGPSKTVPVGRRSGFTSPWGAMYLYRHPECQSICLNSYSRKER